MPATASPGLERARQLLRPELRDAAVVGPEGFIDLLASPPASTGPAQNLMLGRAAPAIYERWWRPALGRLVKGATGPGMDEELRIARLLLGLSEGHRVLDLACGPGNFTRAFAAAVGVEGLAVGVDVSETMLAKGARANQAPNLVLIRADASELPFEDGAFDAVSCFAALHLFADPFAALAELKRVLAVGGRIALMTSIRRRITLPPLKPVVERAGGLRVFEREEIVDALQGLGFSDVHQRVSGLVQFVGGRLSE